MEWVIVTFPRTRDVFVEGERAGRTDRPLTVPTGRQRFDLGTPVDYQPDHQDVDVTGTTENRPMTIAFKAGPLATTPTA